MDIEEQEKEELEEALHHTEEQIHDQEPEMKGRGVMKYIFLL